MKDQEFDPRIGPSIRHKWKAFWRMWRLSTRNHIEIAFDWHILFWDEIYEDWYYLAEYGDTRNNQQDSTPWQLYRYWWERDINKDYVREMMLRKKAERLMRAVRRHKQRHGNWREKVQAEA